MISQAFVLVIAVSHCWWGPDVVGTEAFGAALLLNRPTRKGGGGGGGAGTGPRRSRTCGRVLPVGHGHGATPSSLTPWWYGGNEDRSGGVLLPPSRRSASRLWATTPGGAEQGEEADKDRSESTGKKFGKVSVLKVASLVELTDRLLQARQSAQAEGRSVGAVIVKNNVPDEQFTSSLLLSTSDAGKGRDGEEAVIVVVPPDLVAPIVEPTLPTPPTPPVATIKTRGLAAPGPAEVTGTAASSVVPDLVVSRSATWRDAVEVQRSDDALRNAIFPLHATAGGGSTASASADPKDRSVLSTLFRNNDPRNPSNYFQRSARSPQQQVRSVTYVPLLATDTNNMVETTWTRTEDDVGDGVMPENFLDNKLVLSATIQPDPDEVRRQVRRTVLLYDPQVLERDVLDSFLRTYYRDDDNDDNDDDINTFVPNALLRGVDVTVEVLNQPFYVAAPMVVVITASSTQPRHLDRALEYLFPRLHGPSSSSSSSSPFGPGGTRRLVDPVDIHRMGTAAADDPRQAFHLPYQEYGGYLKNEAACRAFFYWLRWASYAAAVSPHSPNIQAHFRLVPDDGRVYARVVVYAVNEEEERLGLTNDEIDGLPTFPPLPPLGLVELGSAPADFRGAVEVKDGPIKARRLEVAPRVPGLEGVDVVQSGQDGYNGKRDQYASYGGSYASENFMPHIIALPKDESEVVKVVQFAMKKGKRVVTRSGGHQYCGFSSGDERYVQIVMDNFMTKQGAKAFQEKADAVRGRGSSLVSPDKKGAQWFVELTPRFRLKDVSAFLVANRLTIPHGECPGVGIGGHVQTGGYGHQIRGLGLCLDYVYSFDIVVATKLNDPSSVRKVTVYRPELNVSAKDRELNDKLYKGVLGGSPGAFGVITKITFLATHDDDPSVAKSYNVQKVLFHQGGDVDDATAQVVRTMLKYASSSGPKLCEGLDVFVSVVSKGVVGLFDWGIVLPELAYTGNDFSKVVEDQMKEILDACAIKVIPGTGIIPLGQKLAPRPPSKVAHSGVRTAPFGVTWKGREFGFPYKKRVNIMLDTDSMSPADTDKFAQGLGRLASRVVVDPDLLLVIQMLIGGGKSATNDAKKRTGLPYRNQSFVLVFDVFYTDERAKLRAETIQNELQVLLDEVGGGTCFNHRLLWGSFGRERGETDMSQVHVQELYYGNESAYRELQAIKDSVDPNDIFTTEFTVQKSSRQNR